MGRRTLLACLALAPLAACVTAPPPRANDPGDAADIDRVEAYLDGLHSLTARVLQIWPNGGTSQGAAWLRQPGQLRLQYDPPNPSLLVVNNGLVVFEDLTRHSTSSTSLASTPLNILLGGPVRLSGDVTVTRVIRRPGELRVSLVQTRHTDRGTLTVILADNPLSLAGIDLLDARGQETRLRLFDLHPGVAIDPGLFNIDAPVVPKFIDRPPGT